jgi:hypothetical protein
VNVTSPSIDLWADLNTEDDEGRNWSMVDRAREPAALVPGVVLIAGVEGLWSVVRIDAVDDDGQVHFVQLDQEEPAARAVLSAGAQ